MIYKNKKRNRDSNSRKKNLNKSVLLNIILNVLIVNSVSLALSSLSKSFQYQDESGTLLFESFILKT
jgi:hypothetical protein